MVQPTRAPAGAAAGASELAQHWPVLAVAFLTSLVTTGLRFATGPFMSPVAGDLGLTHTQLSAIVAAAMLLFGLAQPAVGRLADGWGSRPVVAGGIVLLAAALLAAAGTRSRLAFAIAYAGVASLALAATGQVALSPVISRWFRRQRGMAMMFLSAGGMGGIAVLTPVSTALIGAVGWRTAYAALALFALAVLLPLAWRVLREAPAVPAAASEAGAGTAPSPAVPAAREPAPAARAAAPAPWRPALATVPFWLLACGMFTCGFSMHLMGTNGVPMLEHHGFPPMTASLGIGLIGLVSIGGTLALGALADRMGRPLFLALIYFVRGLGFLALAAAGREWELYVTAAIGGLVWAGSPALTSALTADLYGARSVGTLFGLLFLIHQVGAAAGAYAGGWAFVAWGDYTGAFVTAALLLFAGAAASWRVAAYPSGPRLTPRAPSAA